MISEKEQKEIYNEGMQAYYEGISLYENPYEIDIIKEKQWNAGWHNCKGSCGFKFIILK